MKKHSMLTLLLIASIYANILKPNNLITKPLEEDIVILYEKLKVLPSDSSSITEKWLQEAADFFYLSDFYEASIKSLCTRGVLDPSALEGRERKALITAENFRGLDHQEKELDSAQRAF